MLDRVGSALSGVTQGASLVLTPKHEAPIKHIEFVSLAPDRALVVLVFADGHVENRLFTPPIGQTPSSMREAANFLNAIAEGQTLSSLGAVIKREISNRRQEIDTLAADLVENGLALWENEGQEQIVLTFGFLFGGFPLYERRTKDYWRSWRHWSDPIELRADRSNCELHGTAGRADADRSLLKEE